MHLICCHEVYESGDMHDSLFSYLESTSCLYLKNLLLSIPNEATLLDVVICPRVFIPFYLTQYVPLPRREGCFILFSLYVIYKYTYLSVCHCLNFHRSLSGSFMALSFRFGCSVCLCEMFMEG